MDICSITVSPGGAALVRSSKCDYVTLAVARESKGPLDVEWTVYVAPFSGIVVALITLYVGHRLTLKRERSKEAMELCAELKTLAESCAELAVEVWSEAERGKREQKVKTLKRKLQSLGSLATFVKERTKSRIDIINPVSQLRVASLSDPLEDFDTNIDEAQVESSEGAINVALASILTSTDRQYNSKYR